MKIMIAGAWDETNENLLSSAFQIAKVAAEKKHIIITGGGTGIPNSATHGALAVNGISIAYSNEGHCEGGHEPATFRVATEMGLGRAKCIGCKVQRPSYCYRWV